MEATHHVVDIPSLPRRPAVADHEAMDGALPALRRRPALSGQEAMDAASVGLGLEVQASATAFGSSPVAADHEAVAGGASVGLAAAAAAGTVINRPAPGYPRPPHAVPPAAGAPNNTDESWMVGDGMQFACIIAVIMGINIKDLSHTWETAPRVLYGLLMQAAVVSLAIGMMAATRAVTARSSSRRSICRRISAFCAKFGLILCTVLLVVYLSFLWRLGWTTGVLSSAVVAGAMTAIWIWGEEPVAAEAVPPP